MDLKEAIEAIYNNNNFNKKLEANLYIHDKTQAGEKHEVKEIATITLNKVNLCYKTINFYKETLGDEEVYYSYKEHDDNITQFKIHKNLLDLEKHFNKKLLLKTARSCRRSEELKALQGF